jgi:hypothetical protein
MADNQCVGWTNNGPRCNSRIGRKHPEFKRCGTHLNTLLRSGLVNTEITEFNSKCNHELRNARDQDKDRIRQRHTREHTELNGRFRTPEFQTLNQQVEDARIVFRQEQEQTRLNREAHYAARRAEREAQHAARVARWEADALARAEQREVHVAELNVGEGHAEFLARIRAVLGGEVNPPNRGELGNFAHDTQNVHTTT